MAKRRRLRRFWHDDEKRQIVAQTRVAGVSVSQVARRYDVNANLVFKWLRDPRYKPPEADVARFLPVEVLSEPAAPEAPDKQIEMHRRSQDQPSRRAYAMALRSSLSGTGTAGQR